MRPLIAALLLALLLVSGCAVAQREASVTAAPMWRERRDDMREVGGPTITATVTATYWNVELTTVPAVVEVKVPAPTNPRDFISVLSVNASTDDFSNWQYAKSAVGGVLIFRVPGPGLYVARHFSLPGATLAPGKMVSAVPVRVPEPRPRPIEINSPNGKVVITRRQTDSVGDVTLKITEDQSLIEVLADKNENVTVKQVKP